VGSNAPNVCAECEAQVAQAEANELLCPAKPAR
jgi:hypothetical protein